MKDLYRISEAELKIAQIIWSLKKATYAQIEERLVQTTNIDSKTISSLIDCLISKRVITAEKTDMDSYIYFPEVSEEEYNALIEDSKTNRRSVKKILVGLSMLILVMAFVIIIYLARGYLSNKPDTAKDAQINISGQVYNSDSLFENKTPYVGNHSKVLHILDNLQFSNYRRKISLQTEKPPYGVTVNYDFQNIIKGDFQKTKIENQERLKLALSRNAALMFSLVNNVDNLTFICYLSSEPTEYRFSRAEVQKDYSEDLREYSKDKNKFGSFVISLNNDNLILHSMSRYSPTMSEVLGLKIMSVYEGKADQIRYTATDGEIFSRNGSNFENQGKILTVPMNSEVYWSPTFGGDTLSKVSTITVKAEALNEGIKVAEQNMRIQNSGLVYTIEENSNIVADVKK